MLTEVTLTLLALYLSYRLSQKGSRGVPLPRVGPPTIFGYIWTAIRFTFHPDRVLAEARARFSGRPYVLPSLGGSLVILSGNDIEFLRRADDKVFNQPSAVTELLSIRQTMDEEMFLGNAYQAGVVRGDLSRAIPALIPEIVDESALALDETIKITPESDSITIPVFSTMTHLIARVSSRALVGKEMCRNSRYTHAMVRFSEGVVIYSYILRFCPVPLRDGLYLVLQYLFGGKKQPLALMVDYLKGYLKDREKMEEKPVLVTEFMLQATPPEILADLSKVAMRLLNINFGSVHTSSMIITHSLYDLAILPESQLEAIREEIREVLVREGGWTKEALAGFTKLESVLREVGRVHGGQIGLLRMTLSDGVLPDGTVIPPGYIVLADFDAVHMNPKMHPNPEVFDPFRFSNLRAQEEKDDAKYLFTSVSKEFLLFGAGRHACPGRFFVAMELKVMLAQILLGYDFKYPPDITTRPKDVLFELGVMPPSINLIFKKRAETH